MTKQSDEALTLEELDSFGEADLSSVYPTQGGRNIQMRSLITAARKSLSAGWHDGYCAAPTFGWLCWFLPNKWVIRNDGTRQCDRCWRIEP